MANELELVTVNAAGNSWVDSTPGLASTGYQAQNTNIEANKNGIDLTSVYWDDTTNEIVCAISGPFDDNGEPIKITSVVRFTPSSDTTYYLRVIPGTADYQRSLELVTSRGTWDDAKNAYYDTYRILNWMIIVSDTQDWAYVLRMDRSADNGQVIEGAAVIDQVTTDKIIGASLTLSKTAIQRIGLSVTAITDTVFTVNYPCLINVYLNAVSGHTSSNHYVIKLGAYYDDTNYTGIRDIDNNQLTVPSYLSYVRPTYFLPGTYLITIDSITGSPSPNTIDVDLDIRSAFGTIDYNDVLT